MLLEGMDQMARNSLNLPPGNTLWYSAGVDFGESYSTYI